MQAIEILRRQRPAGSTFQSSQTITPEFFHSSRIEERNHKLTTEDTPFLYNIIHAMVSDGQDDEDLPMGDEESTPNKTLEEEQEPLDGFVYTPHQRGVYKAVQSRQVCWSTSIKFGCTMVG
jgi:hypothetical protein